MIGFYDYTVVLTYLSLTFSLFGITLAIKGDIKTTIICLALSGLCDMFDGKVARSKKNRTDDEKTFGIQLDSLCDMVCFGVFPAIICYLSGVRGPIGTLILIFYVIAALIRLAYFNVLEGHPTPPTGPCKVKYYHGLPVTSISVILPCAFLMEVFVPTKVFVLILHCLLLIVGLLFIIDFKFKKPSNLQCAILVFATAGVVVCVLYFTHYRLPVHLYKWDWHRLNKLSIHTAYWT